MLVVIRALTALITTNIMFLTDAWHRYVCAIDVYFSTPCRFSRSQRFQHVRNACTTYICSVYYLMFLCHKTRFHSSSHWLCSWQYYNREENIPVLINASMPAVKKSLGCGFNMFTLLVQYAVFSLYWLSIMCFPKSVNKWWDLQMIDMTEVQKIYS